MFTFTLLLTKLLNNNIKQICFTRMIKAMKTETNNEQLILEAAEAEFLEKGYSSAKTTAIAKRAGVTHAMLHYYFRTKENLFQKIFEEKIQLLTSSFNLHSTEKLPFEQIVRNFIEFHFDFLRKNPRLIYFVYNEVVTNEANRNMLFQKLQPRVATVLVQVENLLNEEIAKGTIRPIKFSDLLLNIASMNIVTFMALPILKDLMSEKGSEYLENLINERKESNVQFVLNALRL